MAMGSRESMTVLVLAIILAFLFVAQMDAAGIDDISTRVDSFLEDSVDEFKTFVDEPTRRILAATVSYVSYGALNGNRSPCPSAGRSYYNNCQNTGTVQPYRRGCYQITRCARG